MSKYTPSTRKTWNVSKGYLCILPTLYLSTVGSDANILGGTGWFETEVDLRSRCCTFFPGDQYHGGSAIGGRFGLSWISFVFSPSLSACVCVFVSTSSCQRRWSIVHKYLRSAPSPLFSDGHGSRDTGLRYLVAICRDHDRPFQHYQHKLARLDRATPGRGPSAAITEVKREKLLGCHALLLRCFATRRTYSQRKTCQRCVWRISERFSAVSRYSWCPRHLLFAAGTMPAMW